MKDETLEQRDKVLLRRQVLEPGEATPWHVDPYVRISTIVRGERLRIEYRDGDAAHEFDVAPGDAGWDEPTDRVHRGVNVGSTTYEEVTVFFLDAADAVPQPER